MPKREPKWSQFWSKTRSKSMPKMGPKRELFWSGFGSVLGVSREGLKVENHALAAAGLVFSREPLVAPSALPRRVQSEK